MRHEITFCHPGLGREMVGEAVQAFGNLYFRYLEVRVLLTEHQTSTLLYRQHEHLNSFLSLYDHLSRIRPGSPSVKLQQFYKFYHHTSPKRNTGHAVQELNTGHSYYEGHAGLVGHAGHVGHAAHFGHAGHSGHAGHIYVSCVSKAKQPEKLVQVMDVYQIKEIKKIKKITIIWSHALRLYILQL